MITCFWAFCLCRSRNPSRDSRCSSSLSFFVSLYSYKILIFLNGRRIFFHHYRRASLSSENLERDSYVFEFYCSQCQCSDTAKTHNHELFHVAAPIHVSPIWYDLLDFVDDSKSCSSTMITLPDATSPSPNPDHILWHRQDELLLNAIVGFISTTLMQFISTFTTSCTIWTTLEQTYASPSCGRIMTHH